MGGGGEEGFEIASWTFPPFKTETLPKARASPDLSDKDLRGSSSSSSRRRGRRKRRDLSWFPLLGRREGRRSSRRGGGPDPAGLSAFAPSPSRSCPRGDLQRGAARVVPLPQKQPPRGLQDYSHVSPVCVQRGLLQGKATPPPDRHPPPPFPGKGAVGSGQTFFYKLSGRAFPGKGRRRRRPAARQRQRHNGGVGGSDRSRCHSSGGQTVALHEEL